MCLSPPQRYRHPVLPKALAAGRAPESRQGRGVRLSRIAGTPVRTSEVAMRVCLAVLACLCLVALLPAGPVPADTPATRTPTTAVSAADSGAAAAPAATPDTITVARERNPIMADVRAALEREREQVEALRVRLRGVTDHRAALAIQREIERVKLETEVSILRIQAGAARKAGRLALAKQIDEAIESLLAPPAPATPVTRPAPRAAAR